MSEATHKKLSRLQERQLKKESKERQRRVCNALCAWARFRISGKTYEELAKIARENGAYLSWFQEIDGWILLKHSNRDVYGESLAELISKLNSPLWK